MAGRYTRRTVAAAFAILALGAASAQASSTTFERAWGTDVVTGGGTGFEICLVAADCKAGGFTGVLGGDLRDPEGIAISAAGNVYVADSNERITEFDPRGNFIRAWGRDVVAGGGTGPEICTVAANCQYGNSGPLGGEFQSPQALAIAGGSVYVADNGNQRIQKFDLDGNFIRAWGKDVLTGGVTTFENCTVAASCKQGVQGGGNGELDLPNGVAATDAAVYVADTDNHRITKFSTDGAFLRAWGKDVSTNPGTGPEVCASTCQAGSPGVAGAEFNFPLGVAAGPGDTVYVADTSNQRIQKTNGLGSFLIAWGNDVSTVPGTGFELCTLGSSCKAGVAGGLAGEVADPTALTTDVAGDVYVADFSNRRMQQFGPSGSFVQTWGKDVIVGGAPGAEVCTVAASCKAGVAGGFGGEFLDPFSLAVDSTGAAYVTDSSNERIQRFGSSLEPPPPASPDNSFTIGKLKRKRLKLTVAGPGTVAIADAASKAKRRRLKPVQVAATAAGELTATLKLNAKGKRLLRRAGKVKATAAITFTPTGGAANTQSKALKIKGAKRH